MLYQRLGFKELNQAKEEISKIKDTKLYVADYEDELVFYSEDIDDELNLDENKYRKALIRAEYIKDEHKKFYINKSKIVELLEEKIVIIENYISSKYRSEKQELSYKFIENERNLFDIYQNYSQLRSKISKEILQSKSINSLNFTIIDFIKKLKYSYLLTALIAFSVIFFIFPYSISINDKSNLI